MKLIDDMRASAEAFKDWGRVLTMIGSVIACALVAIAVELFVMCIKI